MKSREITITPAFFVELWKGLEPTERASAAGTPSLILLSEVSVHTSRGCEREMHELIFRVAATDVAELDALMETR